MVIRIVIKKKLNIWWKRIYTYFLSWELTTKLLATIQTINIAEGEKVVKIIELSMEKNSQFDIPFFGSTKVTRLPQLFHTIWSNLLSSDLTKSIFTIWYMAIKDDISSILKQINNNNINKTPKWTMLCFKAVSVENRIILKSN